MEEATVMELHGYTVFIIITTRTHGLLQIIVTISVKTMEYTHLLFLLTKY